MNIDTELRIHFSFRVKNKQLNWKKEEKRGTYNNLTALLLLSSSFKPKQFPGLQFLSSKPAWPNMSTYLPLHSLYKWSAFTGGRPFIPGDLSQWKHRVRQVLLCPGESLPGFTSSFAAIVRAGGAFSLHSALLCCTVKQNRPSTISLLLTAAASGKTFFSELCSQLYHIL